MDREPTIGELVVVARNSGDHSQKIGERLVVCRVDDDDGTLQGVPRGMKSANDWIPWADVEPVTFGWDYARRHLPEDVAGILDACDGIQHIALNSAIKEMILESLPDWRQRVEDAVRPACDSPARKPDEDDADYVDDDTF